MTKNQNILGEAVVSRASALVWLRKHVKHPRLTCSPEALVDAFWEEGAAEGVRPDLLFCLAVKETGWFRYGGIVQPAQNNFGGLGAFNGNAPGEAAHFSTARLGVRAVVQHAKGYATTAPLAQPCVDPRYAVLQEKGWLGSAPTIHELAGCWAWPGYSRAKFKDRAAAYAAGATYGQGITKLYDALLAFHESLSGSKTLKIAFCAGHGWNTPGKRTPDDEREWSFNRQNAEAFEEAMQAYAGIALLRTDDRTGHTDVPLRERTDRANAWGADLYISFHHNAYRGRWGAHGGSETYYWDGAHPWDAQSRKLAESVHQAVLAAYGLRDRGVKRFDFHICREIHAPAVLIEGGFMDSTIDIETMRNRKKTALLGTNVAQAVARLYGLQKRGTPQMEAVCVYALHPADEPAVEELVRQIPNAKRWDGRPEPGAVHYVQVGGEPKDRFTHIVGTDRADTLAKVRQWAAKQGKPTA